MKGFIDTIKIADEITGEIYNFYPQTLIECITNKNGDKLKDTLKQFMTENLSLVIGDDVASKEFVREQVANADHMRREIVTEIPTVETAVENVIYMYKAESDSGNVYKEYQLIDGEIVPMGDTSIDLSDYVRSEELDKLISGETSVGNATKLGGETAEQWQEKLDSIQTKSRASLSQIGWYRVAEYYSKTTSENVVRGARCNTVDLIIKRAFNTLKSELHYLRLTSTFDNQVIQSLHSASGTHAFTKARYVHVNNNTAYLEVYYNSNNYNDTIFIVNNGIDGNTLWKAITPTLTDETVEGVTVTCEYDIPANFNIQDELNKIHSTSSGLLSQVGWYRVAKYEYTTVNGAKGNAGNSCDIFIKAKGVYGGTYKLQLASVYESQVFTAINCVTTSQLYQRIDKIRYTVENTNAYLEIHFNNNMALDCDFEITHPKSVENFTWKAITPNLTEETVEGVTVTTTYDIPANAKPVTDLDLFKTLKLFDGLDFNNIVDTGLYHSANAPLTTNCSNYPENTTGILVVYGSVTKYQSYITYLGNVYTRTSYANTVWSEWVQTATTADLANYLPKTGGIINGSLLARRTTDEEISLNVQNTLRHFYMVVTKNGEAGLYDASKGWIIQSTSENTPRFNGIATGNLPLSGGKIDAYSYTPLVINNTAPESTGTSLLYQLRGENIGAFLVDNFKAKFQDYSTGSAVNWELLHTGNKPSGSYVGNGTAATRTINVGGIGNEILIYSDKGFAIIGRTLGFTVNTNGEVKYYPSGHAVKFDTGNLSMYTVDEVLNANGINYYYKVL